MREVNFLVEYAAELKEMGWKMGRLRLSCMHMHLGKDDKELVFSKKKWGASATVTGAEQHTPCLIWFLAEIDLLLIKLP